MAAQKSNWNLARDSQTLKQAKAIGPLDPEDIYEIFDMVAAFMSDEHREYLERIKSGNGTVDALLDLEMILRLMTIYAPQAVVWSLQEGKVSKEIGAILGEARQSAVAVENMRVKRNESAVKKDDADGMVDPTRKSTLDRFESLFGGSSRGSEGGLN